MGDPNNITTTNEPHHDNNTTWGTLEELLLACAVNRFGTHSWDSVSRELSKRISSSFTPLLCHQKYLDLKRRFAPQNSSETGHDETSLWLDELRKLRVGELRRELQRYDLSIVSLQLKVKRLKEEREQSLEKEKKEERESSDLKEIERESEDDGNDRRNPNAAGESGRKNESVNESNPMDPKPDPVEESLPHPVHPVVDEPDRLEGKPGGEDSCNGSSGSIREPNRERERGDSAELVESVAESKGVKENSDVQSTARLRRKEKKMAVVVISGNSSGDENQSPAVKSPSNGKSQPLIDFLEVVRAHKLGLVFDHRLESQETSKYRDLIRQHMDVGTIKRRLEEGQYADSHTKFYRDLLLLTSNAIVFFAKNSPEQKAAVDLRQLVTKLFRSQLYPHRSPVPEPKPPATPPKPEPDPVDNTNLKPKLAVTGPVVACRKRSSIVGKSSGGEKLGAEEVVKQQVEKTSSSSFNAVKKKRTRDQRSGSRTSSSKNNNNSSNSDKSTPPSQKPSLSTSVLANVAEKKKVIVGNSPNKTIRVSGSGNGSLMGLLMSSVGNGGSSKGSTEPKDITGGGSLKTGRRRDPGSRSCLDSKPGTEKAKDKEERESPASRNTRRPPKRAVAKAAPGKRGREGGGEAESQVKKRQRK